MKRKNYNKLHAKNYFTKETGIPVIQLSGSKHCMVVAQSSITVTHSSGKKQLKVPVAAYHFLHDTPIEDIKSIEQTCGVDQCVHQDHLVAHLHQPDEEQHNVDGWIVSD